MCNRLELGTSANLLMGMRPFWTKDGEGGLPFVRAAEAPFTTFHPDLDPLSAASQWESPTLSLIDSVPELVAAIFGYRVLPFLGRTGTFEIPVSALMLNGLREAGSLEDLSKCLGITQSELVGGGFVLLKMQRRDGECLHDVQRGGIGHIIRLKNYWTLEGRKAMCRLRVTKRISDPKGYRDAFVSASPANRYLDYFHEFGTHFVSRIEFGDLIFQVLKCRPDRYQHLKKICIREAHGTYVTGHLVQGFISFMGKDWISAHGEIKCASGDTLLAESLAAGEWFNAESKHNCLITPMFTDSVVSSKFFGRFGKVVATGLDFAPQSPFMGVFRASACSRLMKGAFLHRYRSGIRISSRQKSPYDCIKEVFGKTMFPSLTDDMEGCRVCFSLATDLGNAECAVSDKRVIFFSGNVSPTTDDDRVKEIVLTDEAFDSFEFVAGEMGGALLVRNREGTRWDTIFDGLRYVSVATGEGQPPRIQIKSDLRSVSKSTLDRLAELIEGSLFATESMLLARTVNRQVAVWCTASWLGWLESCLPEDNGFMLLRSRTISLRQMAVTPDSRFNHSIVDVNLLTRELSTMSDHLSALVHTEAAGRFLDHPEKPDRVAAAYAETTYRLERILCDACDTFSSANAADLKNQEHGEERRYSNSKTEIFIQKWRLVCRLVKFWNLLDDELNSKGVKLPCLREIDLAEIVQSLLWRNRVLSQLIDGSTREEVLPSPRLNARDT